MVSLSTPVFRSNDRYHTVHICCSSTYTIDLRIDLLKCGINIIFCNYNNKQEYINIQHITFSQHTQYTKQYSVSLIVWPVLLRESNHFRLDHDNVLRAWWRYDVLGLPLK